MGFALPIIAGWPPGERAKDVQCAPFKRIEPRIDIRMDPSMMWEMAERLEKEEREI